MRSVSVFSPCLSLSLSVGCVCVCVCVRVCLKNYFVILSSVFLGPVVDLVYYFTVSVGGRWDLAFSTNSVNSVVYKTFHASAWKVASPDSFRWWVIQGLRSGFRFFVSVCYHTHMHACTQIHALRAV